MTGFALPAVAFKGPDDTDAGVLLGAADKLERGFAPGGSNVTAAVVELIRRAVAASGTGPEIAAVCESCSGTGTVECWNPGGPCAEPNAPGCDTCGPCHQCTSGPAPRTTEAAPATEPRAHDEITERPCPLCWAELVWVDDTTGYRCRRCARSVRVPRLRGRFSADRQQWESVRTEKGTVW